MEINDFRKALEKATQGIPRKHPEAIKSLFREYPHSITLECNPNMMDTKSDCFTYAFKEKIPQNIIDKIYSQEGERSNNNEDDRFQELLDNGFISFHDTQKDDDDTILYFENNVVKHFGKIEGDKIISKWGGKGHIWKHAVFEVPFSYGNTVKYSNGQVDIEVLKKIFRISS